MFQTINTMNIVRVWGRLCAGCNSSFRHLLNLTCHVGKMLQVTAVEPSIFHRWFTAQSVVDGIVFTEWIREKVIVNSSAERGRHTANWLEIFSRAERLQLAWISVWTNASAEDGAQTQTQFKVELEWKEISTHIPRVRFWIVDLENLRLPKTGNLNALSFLARTAKPTFVISEDIKFQLWQPIFMQYVYGQVISPRLQDLHKQAI